MHGENLLHSTCGGGWGSSHNGGVAGVKTVNTLTFFLRWWGKRACQRGCTCTFCAAMAATTGLQNVHVRLEETGKKRTTQYMVLTPEKGVYMTDGCTAASLRMYYNYRNTVLAAVQTAVVVVAISFALLGQTAYKLGLVVGAVDEKRSTLQTNVSVVVPLLFRSPPPSPHLTN